MQEQTKELSRLKKLYELSMTVAGNPIEVFGHIARIIGELFELKVVCLSKINGKELEFLAVYLDGQIHTNAGTCNLSITPCATVEVTKDVRVYDRVIERFPEAKFLQMHDAYSYCGFPSIGNDGQVKAVTCLLDDKPRDFTEDDIEILRIFGQRIATELERQQFIEMSSKAQEEIEFLAYHDALTRLPNRRLLIDRLDLIISQAKREESKVGLILLDLDEFKVINDMLGHHVGDLLLVEVSNMLMDSIREMDTLARMGGDEFVIVLNKLSDDCDPAVITEKIISTLAAPMNLDGNEVYVSASIGVAIYPDDGMDAESLMKCADSAMYHAKNSGRNNYKFFTAELDQIAHARMNIVSHLRHAIEHEQFELYYQAKVADNPPRLAGCEALIRWNHPKWGLVSPDQFIPIAESSGFIVPIGEWVINQACRQLKSWEFLGLAIEIAVNLSGRQFYDERLIERICKAFGEHGTAPHRIEFEITESTLMAGANHSTQTLKALGLLGSPMAIDDFGTGYSSLAYLKTFDIDTLKIDRSFVRDIHTDPSDAAIVHAIVSLSHALGIKVVAEGVETEEQVQFLTDLGCDVLQGFHFSKPLPQEQFLKYVAKEFPETLTKAT